MPFPSLLPAVCAAGPTLFGIDVSVYQGSIDWTAVRAAGVEFAFIRVSNGTGILDTRFDANWTNARAAGVLRGAYQYFRPAQDPVAQADLLLDRMGALEDDDLPPVIDVEATDDLPPAAIAAAVGAWLDRVEAGTGRKPIIYSGLYFWMDQVGGATDYVDYPLWIPQYGRTCPTLPAPWTDWRFFQYSATGRVDGISGDVDLDQWNGDRDALLAFARPPAAPTPDAGPPQPGTPDAGVPPAEVDDGAVAGGCAVGSGRRPGGLPFALLLAGAILWACFSSSTTWAASRTRRT